jgi:hypothetical protein
MFLETDLVSPAHLALFKFLSHAGERIERNLNFDITQDVKQFVDDTCKSLVC